MLFRSLSLDQILDKKHVSKLGAGAIAGALIYLERELGGALPERDSLSVFNCYQKAIKLYQQKDSDQLTTQPKFSIDHKALVSGCFAHLPLSDIEMLSKRLETRDLGTVEQAISCLKKLISKKILPTALEYDEEHVTETSKLYAIQSGYYDTQLEDMIRSYTSGDLD